MLSIESSFGSTTRFVSNFHYAIQARDQVADLSSRPAPDALMEIGHNIIDIQEDTLDVQVSCESRLYEVLDRVSPALIKAYII